VPWPTESYSVDKMALWGSGESYGADSYSGVNVDQHTALSLVAVYACVRLIAETIAAMPAELYRKKGAESVEVSRLPLWLTMPNPETTWFDLIERCLSSLNLDGNCFLLITARDDMGFPVEFWTLNPRSIVVRRKNGKVEFIWEGDENHPLSRFGPSNPMGDVLHIKAFSDGGLRGLSPIEVARQAIGLGLATEKYGARFFGKGQGSMPGVIELPAGNPSATTEYVSQMRDAWASAHEGTDKAHKPGFLTGGATWKSISISHEDAQFLDTRKFQVVEIARLFRVPPHLIQELDTTTSWGTGIEQQSIGFVRYSLLPWLVRLESGFNQMTPRGQFLKFEAKGLLRGDAAAQAQAYHQAILDGYMSRSEVRRLEDLPHEPDLDEFLYPSNETIVGQEPVTLAQSTLTPDGTSEP
jgi:HK97 family phage portal protein